MLGLFLKQTKVMTTPNAPKATLVDSKIDIKIKLSALWGALVARAASYVSWRVQSPWNSRSTCIQLGS